MLTSPSVALAAAFVFSILLSSSHANPFPNPSATTALTDDDDANTNTNTNNETCKYTTTHGVTLGKLPLATLIAQAPTLVKCLDTCTNDPYCGSVAFRPPQNSSDYNCISYQQFYYEPVPTQPAPNASYVFAAVEAGSCAKGPAQPRDLRCVPRIVTPKGSSCQYNLTCGRTLDPQTFIEAGMPQAAQATLHNCLMTTSMKPFLGSQVGEAASYTDGGFCYTFQSDYYDEQPTVENKYGFVYQIVKGSCKAKAATPK